MAFVRKKTKVYPWPVEVKRPSEDIPGEFEKFEFKGNTMFLKIVFGTFYSTDSMIVVFQIET